MNEPATIWIPGRGVGKARPRVTKRGVFMPKEYTQYQNHAIKVIRDSGVVFDAPVAVACKFINFKSSDADNLTGSVLDALVKAEALQGDSSSRVTRQEGEFCGVRKKRGVDKPIGILVQIRLQEIETISYEEFEQLLGDMRWQQ